MPPQYLSACLKGVSKTMTLDSPTLNGTKISTEKGEGGRGKSNRIIFTDFTSDLHHIGTVPRRQINDRQLTYLR